MASGLCGFCVDFAGGPVRSPGRRPLWTKNNLGRKRSKDLAPETDDDCMDKKLPAELGIWRLGPTLHQNRDFTVCKAQPIDAAASPRWDYALKFAKTKEGEDGIARTLAVARSVAHPNLVAVLDGAAGVTCPHIVMPLLEGDTMQWHFDRGPRKPLPVALWLVRQICQALAAVHAAGWTHGDVKPANVVVGGNGHVTLIDLAFASRGPQSESVPFRGTPRYAAPELLVNASAVSPASDVYAAGRILWQWLTRVDTSSEVLLRPVCELVEQMIDEAPQKRPSADQITQLLLRLEIDSLGDHIVPSPTPQPLPRAA